ncbi:hypothetical protein AUK22_01030 [bacterium CG2_30_54_10]|nr:MAG: hypothetical protein AUK22_01030 [bacterium CG2_30_54_10]
MNAVMRGANMPKLPKKYLFGEVLATAGVTSQKRGARAPLRLAKRIREAHPLRSGALRHPVCLHSSPDLLR